MTITLQKDPASPTAQAIQIRSHTIMADVTADMGGSDLGPDPHDLYDAALGACKALTVLWYARKRGIPITDIRTGVTRDGKDELAGQYRLRTELVVSGDLSDAQLSELTAVAGKCPVHKLMTSVTTSIDTVVTRA